MPGSGHTDLAFARWDHPAPRGRVVIAHGYGEHGERYRHTARWLNGLGWSVSALDHRGFGRSGGVRGDARGIQGPVEDLTLFLRQERMQDSGRAPARARSPAPGPAGAQLRRPAGAPGPAVAPGHPGRPDRLQSGARACAGCPSPCRCSRPLARWLAPHRPLSLPGDKSRVCSDPALVQRYLEDPLCHRYVSAGFLAAMAEGSRELLEFGGPNWTAPSCSWRRARTRWWTRTAPSPCGRPSVRNCWNGIAWRGFFMRYFMIWPGPEAERLAAQWLDRLFPAPDATPATPGRDTLNAQESHETIPCPDVPAGPPAPGGGLACSRNPRPSRIPTGT